MSQALNIVNAVIGLRFGQVGQDRTALAGNPIHIHNPKEVVTYLFIIFGSLKQAQLILTIYTLLL
jgi:hypothetical protein